MATNSRTGSGGNRSKASPRTTKSASRAPRKSSSSSTEDRRNGTKPSSDARSATDVAAAAASQLRDLSGKEPEGISGLERTDDGWKVEVEVVELRRIPATTDVIAAYEVTVDADGLLQGYRRLRRYSRGDARDE